MTSAPATQPIALEPSADPAKVVARGGFLPSVQALRAVACMLVVGYHLWPEQIRGGFAGVDVFFVISGFLITGHLTRELATEGTIRLPSFYARRARRLLPAALTVLLASAVGVFVLLPVTAWERSFREILASALYFENWSLAGSAVNYFAAEDAPTLVQHFWSLSVEEQFYLGWPLLFLLAAALSRRVRGDRNRRLILGAVPALILVFSFAWSVLPAPSGAEYFSTFTRAWEFATGGLLAVVGTAWVRGWISVVLSWLGWIVVIGSGLLLTSALRFPGWVAIFPVLGTAAVIAAGTPSGRVTLNRLIGSRPVQFTGGISYSLYLWHWPVIILFGRDSGGIEDSGVNRFLLLGISVVLAVLSTYLIEAPLRRRRPSPTPSRRRFRIGGTAGTLGLAAAGMAVVTVVCLAGQHQYQNDQEAARRQVAAIKLHPPACFGAASLDPLLPNCRTGAGVAAASAQSESQDSGADLGSILIPDPVAAFSDKAKTCMQSVTKAPVRACSVGSTTAKYQIALIGDSHAMSWLPALQVIAKERDWRLTAVLKESCPLTKAVRVIDAPSAQTCVEWNKGVQTWITDHPEIQQVIVSASSMNQFVPTPGEKWQDTAVAGYLDAWDELPKTVKRIVVLRDVPRPQSDVVTCSASARSQGKDLHACGRSQAQALLFDPEATAVEQSDRKPALIDLTQYFCADGWCNPAVGGAFVYRDGHHMTATFSRTLAPYLIGVIPRNARN